MNVGLGHQFLRHIERCKVLVLLLDMPQQLAQGTALIMVLPTIMMAVRKYNQQTRIDRRVALAGSKAGSGAATRRNAAKASRTGTMSSVARGVGCMPSTVRTKSSSPSCFLKRPSQLLTVGWLCPICSPARVTLRVL